MNWNVVVLLFVAAVSLHNLEEAIYLPEWSKSLQFRAVAIDAGEFRFAVVALTLVALVLAALSMAGDVLADYALCGYALAMGLNVFMPHLAATVYLRRYAPGAATGLILILPTSFLLLDATLRRGRIDEKIFVWSGPLTVVAMAASIPLLWRLARFFSRRREHQLNRLETLSSLAVRAMASPISGAMVMTRMFLATRMASVGKIVSVTTSSLSFDAEMRATAPPDSTPWVI